MNLLVYLSLEPCLYAYESSAIIIIIVVFLYLQITQLHACEPSRFSSSRRIYTYKYKPFSTPPPPFIYELYLRSLFQLRYHYGLQMYRFV
jgi:hypothetical protein